MNQTDRVIQGWVEMREGGEGGRERKREAIPGRANGTSFLPRVMKMLQLGLKHTEDEGVEEKN